MEFPRPGLYSLGFITGNNAEAQTKTQKRLLCVFVPTPPLTSGSIVLVSEIEVVRLDMSVADGLKFIMSLGSVSPAYPAQELVSTAAAGGSRESGLGEADGNFISPILTPTLVGRSGPSVEANLGTCGAGAR